MDLLDDLNQSLTEALDDAAVDAAVVAEHEEGQEPDVLYCSSVNAPLVDRKFHTYGLYQTENLVCWIDGCGNQGGQRLQQAADKKTFTSAVICSSRTRSDELGYTRGHGQQWYDGFPVVPAGQESFAYWSVHWSKSRKGPAQGYHWFWMRKDAPVMWFDHLHDQGFVFRGIGIVQEVRVVSGTRYETNIKYKKVSKNETQYTHIADPAPRRVLFTHVKLRMYTGASIVDPAWLNLIKMDAVTSAAFEPMGWSGFLRRYFQRYETAPLRRYIFGDTIYGMQPEDLRSDEDVKLPAEFRRGRNTNAKKRIHDLDEEGYNPSNPKGVSILYEDYIRLLSSIQFDRGALNGEPVPGAPPASGLPMPGLTPELLPPDL